MTLNHVHHKNFREEVENSEKPVLVDFFAPWCGPCQNVSPILEEIARDRRDIKICKVNVDEESELASRFKVFSIPTLVFIHEGREVDRIIGARPKNQILAMLG